MSILRLALVTRRYWPLVGGAERVMARLGVELRRLDCQTRIVTAQWESHWPTEVVHCDVPVVRLRNPAQRGWGTMRYMLALNRWLRQNRRQLDAVLVSMLKHDAYSAIGALQSSSVPVVVRAEGGGETGDCHWQRTARFGRRIARRCLQADALVAPSAAVQTELLEAGYAADRVHLIWNGVPIPAAASPTRRRQARHALAEGNFDLRLPNDARLVVYTGRLDRGKGLMDLVAAWSMVRQKFVDSRLWLVGDGPLRDELYQYLKDYDLRDSVLLPGTYDDIDEVLMAADAFVLPSYAEGLSLSLLEAMAARVPVVVSDIPANLRLVQPDHTGIVFPVRDAAALAAALCRLLEDPAAARQRAENAYALVQQQYSVERMARDHLQLIQSVVQAKSAGGS